MLTPEEAAELAPKALELADTLIKAFGPESDGGRKLTKDERKDIGKKAKTFGLKLLVDAID